MGNAHRHSSPAGCAVARRRGASRGLLGGQPPPKRLVGLRHPDHFDGRASHRRDGGLRFIADRTIYDADEPIDTLLVAGDPSLQTGDPVATEWLRRRVPDVRRFGSICTGVFLLAEAGLLHGKRVTTHWECAERFALRFPNIALDADAIYLRDGPLVTAAGVTAGIDLALSLVEEDHGRDIALAVARYLVVFLKRPGGQSQFSTHLFGQMAETTMVQKAQSYILQNLAGDLSVDHVASRIGMSPRNFARMFRRELGITPAGFVASARVDAARRLLEDTEQPLRRVALNCGFSNMNTMRRIFCKTAGVTPAAYRSRFHRSGEPKLK